MMLTECSAFKARSVLVGDSMSARSPSNASTDSLVHKVLDAAKQRESCEVNFDVERKEGYRHTGHRKAFGSG